MTQAWSPVICNIPIYGFVERATISRTSPSILRPSLPIFLTPTFTVSPFNAPKSLFCGIKISSCRFSTETNPYPSLVRDIFPTHSIMCFSFFTDALLFRFRSAEAPDAFLKNFFCEFLRCFLFDLCLFLILETFLPILAKLQYFTYKSLPLRAHILL